MDPEDKNRKREGIYKKIIIVKEETSKEGVDQLINRVMKFQVEGLEVEKSREEYNKGEMHQKGAQEKREMCHKRVQERIGHERSEVQKLCQRRMSRVELVELEVVMINHN